jgi:hypothetical protein
VTAGGFERVTYTDVAKAKTQIDGFLEPGVYALVPSDRGVTVISLQGAGDADIADIELSTDTPLGTVLYDTRRHAGDSYEVVRSSDASGQAAMRQVAAIGGGVLGLRTPAGATLHNFRAPSHR